LSASYSDGPIILDIDKNRINQVMSNLVSNAVKFTEEGTISINVETSAKEVLVTVRDTGPGINPKIVPKLFTKFSSDSQGGTGLGLYVSKNIIEAHGGKIWADNNVGNGKGASFYFTIPIDN
jgi:signal transduction histidine kinase